MPRTHLCLGALRKTEHLCKPCSAVQGSRLVRKFSLCEYPISVNSCFITARLINYLCRLNRVSLIITPCSCPAVAHQVGIIAISVRLGCAFMAAHPDITHNCLNATSSVPPSAGALSSCLCLHCM